MRPAKRGLNIETKLAV